MDIIVENPWEVLIETEVVTDVEIERPVDVYVEVSKPKIVKNVIWKTIERPIYVDITKDKIV